MFSLFYYQGNKRGGTKSPNRRKIHLSLERTRQSQIILLEVIILNRYSCLRNL